MAAIPRRRALTIRLLLLTALVVPAFSFAGIVTSRAAPILSPGASTAHPYSNPVWWPLSTGSTMGCYRGNPTLAPDRLPTCREPVIQHSVWAVDIISAQRTIADPHEGVYAMGAGIVHYGATGVGCGSAASAGRGNWIWIDHGNGVLSQYGHLGLISVRSGQYVTARTKIAEVGNSGYSNCNVVNNMRYLWLAIKHGGTSGVYYHFPSTLACVNGVANSWPRKLSSNRSGWVDWNQVPSHQLLDTPDKTRTCIPATPATSNAPSSAGMVHPAAGQLKAYWKAAPAAARVTVINVQFQLWHPSIGQWLDLENRRLTPPATSTTFRSLQNGRHYRMRVSFANSVGWSAASPWANATALG
ncbi:MAG: Peptidase family [Pseudonocardiales bacterium]|jgi:hypothetical protein|nr:Peptidase family [Pseudonocardiales bacterium]